MDPKNRWLTYFLLVVNAILIAFVANLLINLKAEVGELKEVLTTQADLQAVQTGKADPFSPQEICMRCHTERRFTDTHGTKDELVRIIRRMQAQPDTRIGDQEMDRVHDAITLLKCTQCHSSDTMKELSLMDSVQRLSVIKGMTKKAGSQIPVEEAKDILKAYESMSGF